MIHFLFFILIFTRTIIGQAWNDLEFVADVEFLLFFSGTGSVEILGHVPARRLNEVIVIRCVLQSFLHQKTCDSFALLIFWSNGMLEVEHTVRKLSVSEIRLRAGV